MSEILKTEAANVASELLNNDAMNGRIRAHIVGIVEKSIIAELLKLTRGNQTKVAEVLGVNRGTLRRKLHIYGFI